ncbi:MAG: hypothetical protein K0Q76_3321 [Panacagrimonas sp.]|nr:hypothetical protein [Panacagrimonas sp.]MCC2658213.1 hypothetical protein [Panacagrimonas sp.]
MNALASGLTGMLLAALACLVPMAEAQAEDPVAADRSRALIDDPMASAALVRVLQHHHGLGDGEGGFGWWLRLPFPVRARQAQVPNVRLWRNRLEFMRDAQRSDAAACAVSGTMVLDNPLLDSASRAVEAQRLDRCRGGTGE